MKTNQKNKKMNPLLISFIFIAVFSASCKVSQKLVQNSDPVGTHIGNMTFSNERPFNQTELIIGRRICQALKQKRGFFEALYDRQERISFQGTLVDCQGTVTLDTPFIASIGNASALEYLAITTRENYFRDIVTEQSGAMNDICASLSATDNVSNTVKSGSLKYTVNFLIAENYDRFDIRKEISDDKGVFTIFGAESISVITQKNQAAEKFFGVEKERIRLIRCENGKYQSMKQTWKEALTTF